MSELSSSLLSRRDGNAGGQITRADAAGGLLRLPHGPRERAPEPPRHERADRQRADRRDQEPAHGRSEQRVDLPREDDDGEHRLGTAARRLGDAHRRRCGGEHERSSSPGQRLPGAQLDQVEIRARHPTRERVDRAPAGPETNDGDALEVEGVAQVGQHPQLTLVVEVLDRRGDLAGLRPQLALGLLPRAQASEHERADPREQQRGRDRAEDDQREATGHAQLLEPVADAAHGRERKAVAQLLAQLPNMDVDGALVAVPVRAPRAIEQLTA